MKVVCFIPDYNDKHAMILTAFAEGCGARCMPLAKAHEVDCDIAVIFGWYKYAFKPTMPKKPLIDRQLAKGPKHLILIESSFYSRGTYYQIGWDGFAGLADFCNQNSPPDRWEASIKPKALLPWKKPDYKEIIICGQLPRDTQVQDVDHIKWCQDTVRHYELTKQRQERIRFRPHPRQADFSIYGVKIKYLDQRKIFRSLKRANKCVTYNSTTVVDALFHGVFPIAHSDSSILSKSKFRAISRQSVAEYELNDYRLNFFHDLAYAQWTIDEMRQGLPWQHLTRSL